MTAAASSLYGGFLPGIEEAFRQMADTQSPGLPHNDLSWVFRLFFEKGATRSLGMRNP